MSNYWNYAWKIWNSVWERNIIYVMTDNSNYTTLAYLAIVLLVFSYWNKYDSFYNYAIPCKELVRLNFILKVLYEAFCILLYEGKAQNTWRLFWDTNITVYSLFHNTDLHQPPFARCGLDISSIITCLLLDVCEVAIVRL